MREQSPSSRNRAAPMHGHGPPGPRGLALACFIDDYRRNGLPALERLVHGYGDIVSIDLFGRQALLLAHPDLVQHVLIDARDNYTKSPGSKSSRRFFGKSMQLASGDHARRMRRLVAPLFQPDRLAHAYADAIVQATSAAMARWQHMPAAGREQTLTRTLMDLILDIAVQIHVGTEPGKESQRIGSLFLAAMSCLGNFMLPDWLPTARNRRYRQAVAALDAGILARIRACRAGAGGHDLLSALARLEDEHGRGLSDQQVRDEIVTMMSAGYQSVAIAVNQTVRLVAEHAPVGERLAQELAVLAGQPPAAETLASLPYTGKVIKESLRCCPPAGVFMRRAVADDTIAGWRIPAGARVFLPAWVLHRDARFYGNPLAFDPARWTPAFEQSLPRCAYMPFGRGPRGCIASALASLIAELVLVTILQRYRLEALYTTPAHQSSWPAILARGGLAVRVHPRHPGE